MLMVHRPLPDSVVGEGNYIKFKGLLAEALGKTLYAYIP